MSTANFEVVIVDWRNYINHIYSGASASTTWNQPSCRECGAREIIADHVCQLELPLVLRRKRRHL